MERGWERSKSVLAERFARDEIPGFLKKEFVAKGNEFVVLEKDGEIYLEKGAGKLVITSFGEDFTDIILVDKAEKTLENTIKNVCLADGRGICIKITLKFRIFNSDHMSKNLMGERERLFIDDVRDQLMSDVLCRDMLSRIQKKGVKSLIDDACCEKIKADIANAVKKKFREWGLILGSMSVDFDTGELPPVEKRLPKPAGQAIENETEASAMTEEEDLSSLEKERTEREVRMALEKKQMQRDVEDALEALKLRNVQKKGKELKEIEAKESEKTRLEEELETLRKAKEITEKKFYKKEISEESFQRMMEDFEKRIIEIETKLKRQ